MRFGNVVNPTEKPFVSVIVPAHNEEAYLGSCLESLERQDYAGSYEVIVVDNASVDGTAELGRQRGVRIVYEPEESPACARQSGLESARGEVVAFIDADSRAPRNWLSSLASRFATQPDLVVISGPYAFYDAGTASRLVSYVANAVCISLDHVFRRLCGKGGALWGSNFAVRRAALIGAGGFNRAIEFLGEDYELSLRLRGKGRAGVLPTLVVLTSARRLREDGPVSTYWNYIVNYFYVLFAGRPIPLRLQAVPRRLATYVAPGLRYLLPVARYVLLAVVLAAAVSVNRAMPTVMAAVLGLCGFLTLAIYDGVSPRSQLYGPIIRAADRGVKHVALTFDDGPNPRCTSRVLETLARYNVRATFFPTGRNCSRHPDLCRAIVEAGHAVGNHSYSHERLLCLKTPHRIAHDLDRAERAIEDVTGAIPRSFRPPYGFRSPWLMRLLRVRGYTVVTWDVMTKDWDDHKRSDEIVRDVMSRAKRGSIIVLHDGRSRHENCDRQNLLQALPEVITSLKERGLEFVTVPEMLNSPVR